MAEPRRSMGLTTACSVGVVRFGVVFVQFTITEGGPCAKILLLDTAHSTTKAARRRPGTVLERETVDCMRAMLGMP